MQNTLIDNSNEQLSMVHTLKECIAQNVNHIRIATGYWDIPGTALIADELEEFLQKEGSLLQLLIGKDPYVYASQVKTPIYKDASYPKDFITRDINALTEELKDEYKKVVRLLLKYCEGESPKIQIRIYKKNEEDEIQFLHSKCYIFTNDPHNIGALGIIGSSNFTQKGLEGNAELNYLETNSMVVTYPQNADNLKGHTVWFDEKWNLSEDWTKEFLEQILKKTEPAKIVEEEDQEAKEAQILSPYESYIRILNDRFSAVANSDIESELKSYLPSKYRPLKYQLDAAALCFQIMQQHGGFMLGDVVGLGKTIVGILLVKYYLEVASSIGRERKVLIVVPPAIKSAWLKTIAEFDENRDDKILPCIEFITTGSIDKLLDDGSEETDSTGEFEEELKEETYGLILIDESHNFRNNETQMYEALDDLIAEIGVRKGYYPYVGLLSATLQNNGPEDLRNQLYLFQRTPKESTINVEGYNLEAFFVDACDRYRKILSQPNNSITQQKTNREALIFLSKEIHDKVLAEVLVRRTRSDVKNGYKEDLHFPEVVGPNKLTYTMSETLAQLFYETMDVVAPDKENLPADGRYISFMRYRATEYLTEELKKRYTGRNMNPEKSSARLARIMQILLVKRLESSFTAFRSSLENLLRYSENMKTMWDNNCIFICPQIDVNKELYLAEKQQKYGADYTLEDCFNDIRKKIKKLEKEGRNQKKQNAEYHCADFSPKYYQFLCEDLKLIKEFKERWDEMEEDPKLTEFRNSLDGKLFDPKKNGPHKLVIFSEAIDTVKELADVATEKGYRVLSITAANRDEKETAIRANFDANYDPEKWEHNYDIIITTEVLAEGVNLHRANTILNYDTPWNSTRLIQRIGRVNRIGSKESHVYVYNFFPSSEGDTQIRLVQRAYTKLQSFHTLFGEDSKVFTEEEELSQVDYKELVDGQETPYTRFIAELQAYKEEHPARFEAITEIPAPILTGYCSTDDTHYCLVKTTDNEAGSIYVRIKSAGEPEIISALDMFEACECDPETSGVLAENLQELQTKAIQAYNVYASRLHRAHTSKKIDDGKEAVRLLMRDTRISDESRRLLRIAQRLIGHGDLAIAKVVKRISDDMNSQQTRLFEITSEDINDRINQELARIADQVKVQNGEPYLFLATSLYSRDTLEELKNNNAVTIIKYHG